MIRRDFLGRGTVALGALAGLPPSVLAHRLNAERSLGAWLHHALPERADAAAPERLADDEPFWAELRRAYDLDATVVNLDHGWTNPAPRAAMETLVEGARALESLPAEQLLRLWEETTNTSVRQAMAAAMGVPPTELAFVRNATEALNTVLLGVPLRAGDEIVCSAHDYFAMLDALEQRRARDGVVLRMVRPPVPAPSMDALVDTYAAAIGPRTRLVLLTHPSNLTGQLLPVHRIAGLAHAVGAEVVVDGAQSLGLFDEPVSALGCDYYGASAHKWLGAPVGMGMLWMRPEHVAKVWPAVPPPTHVTGMARFEWIGTAPEYVGPSLGPALAVHASLGAARKAARLRYLATQLRARVSAALPQVSYYTAADAAMSCGITTLALPGTDVAALQRRLRERDGILVQAMTGMARSPEIDGLRVTPNVYTTLDELDRLAAALAR